MGKNLIPLIVVTLVGSAHAQAQPATDTNRATSATAASVHLQSVGYIGLSVVADFRIRNSHPHGIFNPNTYKTH